MLATWFLPTVLMLGKGRAVLKVLEWKFSTKVPFLIIMFLGVLILEVIGCAASVMERTIRPGDIAWIQNGQTTREQVIGKFGEPNFAFSTTGDFGTGAGEYVEYRQPTPVGNSSAGGLSLEVRPRGGRTAQVYQQPLESTVRSPEAGPAFWVLYDGQGVVKASGFESSPRSVLLVSALW